MTLGAVLANVAILQIAGAGEAAGEQLWSLYYVATALYGMAFPLAAFLLVEGAFHTSDKVKFLKRLIVAALLAEIPLDWATYGFAGVKDWGSKQNYFFTLALGLLVLLLAERLGEKFSTGSVKYNLLTLVLYLMATFTASLFRFEQAGLGILVILAFYLFRGNKVFSLVTVAALYLFFAGNSGALSYFPAIAVLFTWAYNGEEGPHSEKLRFCLYAAYPAVQCLFGVIARLIW